MRHHAQTTIAALLGAATLFIPTASADEVVDQPSTPTSSDGEDLAKQLSNPISALISVPLQTNAEFGGGQNDDGFRFVLNVQPVVPITLSEDWNLISRTILPIVYQNSMLTAANQTGLGDVTQSLFFSPARPGPGGIVSGVGPAALVPTATDSMLGTEKLGIGPTAVVLSQRSGWTVGALANHIWSVAGNADRSDVSTTFLQPFVSYTTATKTTFGLNSESTYDWERSQWTVPINVIVSQLVKIESVPVQLGLGAKGYADGPMGTPSWGLRFVATFLFPR